MNYILSIAGFDPSGGAGVLADVKTAESTGAYALGVVSALTYQNDITFNAVDWIPVDKIINQMELLYQRFEINVVKIGLIENMEVLQKIIDYIILKNKDSLIIWDPILKASAGFQFHNCVQQVLFNKILDKIYLITPNELEIQQLFETTNIDKLTDYIKLFPSLNVLYKGGHTGGENATDILISGKSVSYFQTLRILNVDKHGTGCVLSSAISSYLAQDYDLNKACEKAKEYMNTFLVSSDTLLGIHRNCINL